MARLPRTISWMRGGAPAMARASADCDSRIGRRNSSMRISPGWGFGRSSAMVVGDFDIMRVALFPPEADPPLDIDSSAPFPCPVVPQLLEPVARRHTQVVDPRGCIHLPPKPWNA